MPEMLGMMRLAPAAKCYRAGSTMPA
jgi:hypothetical protein